MARNGTITPIEPSMIARATQAARYLITGQKPDDWFGPSTPIQPTAPPEIRGRAFDYPIGYNLHSQPRKSEPISFATLRTMADALPILRVAIETRKDQIDAMAWTIKPKEGNTRQKITGNYLTRIKPIEAFLSFPDKTNTFSAWLRCLLEDMFVIDAATIYPRLTKGGQLYSLDIIDGSTITRIIDESGRTPLAPDIAYQQILHGIVAGAFNRDELLYLPRNIRPHKLYGFSHVEQILLTINIALQREMHTADFYKSGTTLPGIATVPAEWTPEQIEQFQNYFDSAMEGNSAQRNKIKFVANGTQYTAIGHQPLKDAYDEWIARVICYTFSLPPTPFINSNNRSTAEVQQNSGMSEGLSPLKMWVKNFINAIILRYFDANDLEFAWVEDATFNEADRALADASDVKTGIRSIDEVRDARGLDPIGIENALLTATGIIPLKHAFDAALKPDNQHKPAQQPIPETASATTSSESGGNASDETATTKLNSLFKKSPQSKTITVKTPSLDRSLAVLAQERLYKATTTVLARVGQSTAREVKAQLGEVAKAAYDTNTDQEGERSGLSDAEADQKADAILATLDLAGFLFLIPAAFSEIRTVAVDSVDYVLKPLFDDVTVTIGADAEQKLVGVINQKAIEWARARSAELVGMAYNSEGVLVVSDAAQMSIVETTRATIKDIIVKGLSDNIGRQAIADNIASSLAFSPERALLIAETEIARANEYSSLLSMLEIAQQVGLSTTKSWATAQDERVCHGLCEANEAEGKIDINDNFQSGDPCAPAHPRCRCATYYYQTFKRN